MTYIGLIFLIYHCFVCLYLRMFDNVNHISPYVGLLSYFIITNKYIYIYMHSLFF